MPPLVSPQAAAGSVYSNSLLLAEKTSRGAVALCIVLSLKELYL